MSRILQEFYCGECDGYFRLKLNIALNYEVEVQCPKCGHLHRRCVVEGQVYEQGRYQTNVKEKLIASDATYSKTPITEKMLAAHESKKFNQRRDGVPLPRTPYEEEEFGERWASLASKQG